MNRHSPLFRVAFNSLSLAIALPLLLFCFANVRHRQLQAKGTRWGQIAKVNGTAAQAVTKPITTPVITASKSVPSTNEASLNDAPGVSARAVSHLRDLTGSVTGSTPIEMPVAKPNVLVAQSEPSPTTAPAPPVVEVQRRLHVEFQPANDAATSSQTASEQVESKLAGMQRRLDQLAQAQVDGKLSELDRAAKLLEKLEQSRPKAVVSQLDSSADLIPTPVPNAEPPAPRARTSEPNSTSGREGTGRDGAIREGTIKVIQSEKGVHSEGSLADEKFSLQVHDAELTQLLDMLAQLAGVNILPSADVQGRVTLNLQDVTVDRALEAILKSRGFIHEREADFIYVRSEAEVARIKLRNRQLVSKLYQPMYISASELSKLLTPLLTREIGQHSVTSPIPIGDTAGDEFAQRDALLVQDYPEVIAAIDRVIIEMDVPPLQVLIEAKILSVTLSDTMEYGVNFTLLNGRHPGVGATLPTADRVGNTCGLKHGFVSDVAGFIKSLESIGDTSLVSAPSIRVVNKQKAEMIIGDRLSYKTLAFNGAQTIENVQFLDAGTKLMFRPFISQDGLVRLEVHPERSSATINKGTGLPSLSTTEVTTNIMVRDGCTVVIGGLISEETMESIDRVPLLSAIPLVGATFRNKAERTKRTELIVLLTPHIVTEPEAVIEGAALQAETEDRAAHFRDNLSHVNRHNLTRGHYERAQDYFDQGNLLKARQQIDAALKQNKADLESLRLKAQIEQATHEQHGTFWKRPGTLKPGSRR